MPLLAHTQWTQFEEFPTFLEGIPSAQQFDATNPRFGTASTASVLQASGFRGDVTVFRLNARRRPETASECAFRRNTAEHVYAIEAAHNPEVAGSNPAPATQKARTRGPFRWEGDAC